MWLWGWRDELEKGFRDSHSGILSTVPTYLTSIPASQDTPPCRDAMSRHHCFLEISPHVFFIFHSFREVKDCFSSYLRATTACSCGSGGASNEGPLVLAWSLPSQDVPDAGNREQFPLSLDVRGCFVISFVDEESVSSIRLLLYGFCHGIGTEYLFSRTRSAICIPNCSWQCRRPTNANLPEAWPIRASI